MDWGVLAIVLWFGFFVWQIRPRRPSNDITLGMDNATAERMDTLRRQTGFTTIEVFRAALRTYEYTVQQRLDGATFYRNQNPLTWADDVPDNLPEDAPEPEVIEIPPEPEPEPEYEDKDDDRPTAWDRMRF